MKFGYPWSKKEDFPKEQSGSLEEEIEDLHRLYSRTHPRYTDEQWMKESIKIAMEAERAYNNEEAIRHWKRVAALAKTNQEVKKAAINHIKILQKILTKGNEEEVVNQALRFARESEAKGDRAEAAKHWHRVVTVSAQESEIWKKAREKLSEHEKP